MANRRVYALSLLVTSPIYACPTPLRIEIQTTLNVRKVAFIHKYRPILIIFVILTATVVFGTDMWYIVTANTLGLNIYNFYFIIMFIVLIFMITFSGVKLIKTMRSAWEHTSNAAHYKFVKKVSNVGICGNVTS
jgi:hypothetical protein